VLGERAEAGTGLADLLHDVQQVLQRARKPIKLPDHDDIARTQVVQQALKLWPVPSAAGGFLLEQAGASGGTERGALLRQILPLTGDAAVAQDGAGGLLRRRGAHFHKRTFASGLRHQQFPREYCFTIL